MPTPDDARLLFVISDDYGELGNALQFVTGQACARRTVLLLPPRLYAVNRETLPARSLEYSTVDDVIAGVQAWKPDIVFLFSGYLYTINSLFSIESLEALLRSLRRSGCRVVTSDPFLGAQAEPDTAADLAAIHGPFVRAFELLQDAVHFYPVPVSHVSRRIVSISTFNPALSRTPAGAVDAITQRVLTDGGVNASTPFWLFILSNEDYKLQAAKHGAAAFAGHVVGLLRGTLAEGRTPVFIGPPACIDSIAVRLTDTAGIVLQSFCPHALFTSLLLDAEYAFYWNMFSNSLVVRLGSGLPSFFFDVGHLGRWYELAVRNYFQGWRPVCLDQRQEIGVPVVRLLHALFRKDVQRIQDHYRTAPPPDEVIATLLQRQPA